MHYEAYRDLIQRLESEAARDPRGYTLRVGAFGLLGYLYIVGVIVGLVTLLAVLPRVTHGSGSALFSIKLGILILPIAVVLGKGLIVRFAAPRGVPLMRGRVPELFTMIDEVAVKLRAPAPHCVLLTADYNCCVLQRPRLGIFGWPEQILVLGLPMMETLSRARFRAVLAHEFGHLAADHSTFAGRLHQVSDAWETLLHHLESNRNVTARLFRPFFRWYGPRFQAMGFVLGRRQEYFADLCSRRVAGVRAARGALVRIEVMANVFRETMEATIAPRVRRDPAPAEDVVPLVCQRMRENPEPDRTRTWIDEALRAETGYEHTHPALKDRLEALEPGVMPALDDALAKPGASAAQELLGNAYTSLAREAGAFWAAEVADSWGVRHRQLAEAECIPGGTVDGAEGELPSPESAWATVCARIDLDGERGADDWLAAFVESHPDHAMAHFRLGQIQLQRGDDGGLERLERAMELESDAIPAGCRMAVDYLRAQGRGRQAEEYTRRAWEFADLAQKSEDERRFLRRKDRFVAHGLSVATISRLRKRLARESWIAAAYLVRKDVTLRTEKPCYVLGVRLYRRWYKLADPARESSSATVLLRDDVIPAGTWMFVLDGDLAWARKRLAKVDHALIWSRPRRSHPAEHNRAA